MELLLIILSGLAQGILEWLPVSSEGILTIILTALGTGPAEALNTAIYMHLGTLLAAIVYFHKEVKEVLLFKNKSLLKFLLIATLITIIVGAPIYFTLSSILSAVTGKTAILLVGVFLIFTAFLLKKSRKNSKTKGITIKESVPSGLVQGFSVIPGISRSGVTTSYFLLRGFNAKTALKYSFLMSIPAVLAANIGIEFMNFSFRPELLLGLLTAFVTGILSIKILVGLAERINLWKFILIIGVISIAQIIL